MTNRLHRYYGTHDLHFITSSCYRRRPELGSAWRRDLFVEILEETRRKYRFIVHGYVVMPEHFHLLITEPEVGDPSVVMKVIKERFSRRLNWLRRQAAAEGVIWGSGCGSRFGRSAFTISTYGALASRSRSCVTCTAIR